MDFLRGVVLPLLLLVVALSLGFLGYVAGQDAHLLAARAAAVTSDRGDLAPRAETEARRRVLRKRAQEVGTQSLGLYGAAGLVLALDALLLLARLRPFRLTDPDGPARASSAGPR